MTVDPETLFEQAPPTADTYLRHAIEDIDRRFGDGFAKNHPELVGAYIQTCALDYGASMIARALETVGLSIESIAGEIQNDSWLANLHSQPHQ
jgi:hypothetical protein